MLVIGVGLVEELDGLVHRHVQHVADGLVTEGHVQRVAAEAFAVAGLARQRDVGHELHLDGDGALALALLAAPAGGVEREETGVIAHLLGQLLLGEQLAYLVKGLQIGRGIAARALADGPLVDEFHGLQAAQVAGDAAVAAGHLGRLVIVAGQGGVEDLAHQRRFARAAHAGNDGHHAQRELDVDVLEVVLCGAFDLDVLAPLAASLGQGNGQRTGEVFGGVTLGGLGQLVDGSLIGDTSAVAACLGTHVNQVVGTADDVLVVLDHHHGVAHLLQHAQHMDQPVGVARMQADGWLVEDVHRAHERTAQGGCQVDALALAARQRRRQAVQRQVAHTHVTQVLKTAVDLGEQTLGNLGVGIVEFEVLEPLPQVLDRHAHHLADGDAAHLHVARLRFQPRAVAVGTHRLAAVARQQHAELDGVGLALDPLKEAVDAAPAAVARAVPQQVALLWCQFVVGLVDGEIVL